MLYGNAVVVEKTQKMLCDTGHIHNSLKRYDGRTTNRNILLTYLLITITDAFGDWFVGRDARSDVVGKGFKPVDLHFDVKLFNDP